MTSTDDFKWEFGHGLSYSTFVYSNLQLSNDTIVAPAGTVDVSFSVYNQGPFAGAHSILVFLKDNFREVTPETKLLWTFTKVSLGVGETYNFHATVQVSDLAFYGYLAHKIIHPCKINFIFFQHRRKCQGDRGWHTHGPGRGPVCYIYPRRLKSFPPPI